MGLLDSLRSRPPKDVSDPAPRTRISATITTGSSVAAAQRTPSVYLASDRWDDLLVSRADGYPPFRLVKHHRELWLAEEQTGLLVNVANQRLRPLGISLGRARGMQHHAAIVTAANLRPRAALTLVRERDNEHDGNAVAIHADAGPIGYVNKQMAAGLARQLDADVPLRAVSFGQGRWIAANPGVIGWLFRR